MCLGKFVIVDIISSFMMLLDLCNVYVFAVCNMTSSCYDTAC